MSSSSQNQTKSEPSMLTTIRSGWIKARKPKPSVDAADSARALNQTPSARLFEPANSIPATPDTASSPSSKSNNTALTALKQVVPALSAISRSASLPGLDVTFDLLLTSINQVETTSENLEDLVIRLKTLKSTLSQFDGAGKASGDLDHLLDPLRRELESLRTDIDKAGSRGGLERFIDSTESASSLASHNVTLNRIISQLTLVLSTSKSPTFSETHQGVSRVENVLSSRGESAAGDMTQIFRGAKINTVGGRTGTGGHVGSGNLGMRLQDYEQAVIATGGGNVGSNNTSLAALEIELAMRLKLPDMKIFA